MTDQQKFFVAVALSIAAGFVVMAIVDKLTGNYKRR